MASPLLGRFPIDVAGTFAYFYLGNRLNSTDAIVEDDAVTVPGDDREPVY